MSKPKTFEEWDTNVRPGLPRFRDAGRSDRRSAWNAAREALMAELLEAEKTYPEDPSRVIEWFVGGSVGSWYVPVELLLALTGLVARLRGDLSESRAESAALRKKVEDLLAHAREVEDQRNDLQERWSDEHDEAQRLRRRLAEVEENSDRGTGREDRGMDGGAMSEHEPTKKLLEAVNDSKRLDGDPDVLVSMAERVLAEALAYAVEGYADLMDVAPPLLNDVESSKKQIIFIMDALAATSACRYRDAHE